MRILIVGGGGREHALAWKIAQSPQVRQVFVAPGNAGTEAEPKTQNIAIRVEDIPALAEFARVCRIDLTIIGPEAPLVAGIVDVFTEAGLRCFGPNRLAAQLEGSKTFSKDFLARHRIPTARYQSFTELTPALAYLRDQAMPIVIKADGLAAGKGVVIAHDLNAAQTAVTDMLSGKAFGAAGRRIVIEEFLAGEEASFIVLCDGEHALPLASSQDHKARDDGDQGPNTGGMGAYSPAPVVTPALQRRILARIIEPTVRGLASEGICYRGFLYAGLMITPAGEPKVLEFNCRSGDPETQPLLLRLRSDLVALCEAALDGQLAHTQADWDSRPALGVVLAAGGYPEWYRTGDPITLPARLDPDTKLFHAGTARSAQGIITAGGRVLCATALGATVADAQARAYELARRVSWADRYYRSDIGYRAVARERERT